jgi:hypothetical protein
MRILECESPVAFDSAQVLVEFTEIPTRSSRLEAQSVKTLRDYLKIAKASKFLGVSQNTLRKWADQGQIPVYVNKANGYRLFLQKDLEKFLGDTAKPAKKPRKTR